MFDLTKYSPADFLLFSERVYNRLFELHNEALWPLHFPMIAAAFFILYNLLRPSPSGSQFTYGALAIVWASVGWTFFWLHYSTINWVAPYVAPIFAVQALLLVVFELLPSIRTRKPTRPLDYVAVAIFLFCVIGYPFVALANGSIRQAEVFGLAPDPSALATLAVLALTTGPGTAIAWIIPVLWCCATALTLWTLGSPWFAVVLILMGVLVAVRLSAPAEKTQDVSAAAT